MKLKTRLFLHGAFWLIGVSSLAVGFFRSPQPQAKLSQTSTEKSAPLKRDGDQIILPEGSPLRQAVQVMTVTQEAITIPFVLPATVEADPSRVAKVISPLTGRIVKLSKRLGDEVQAGEELFSVDSAELAGAVSDASKAQSALILARRNLDRQKELNQSELNAKRELEQAQSDYDQAQSEVMRSNARLVQLGANGMITTPGRPSGHVLVVRSPISGTIIDQAGTAGSYWNDANAPLMTVADLSHVFINANAPERDLSQIFIGQAATVRVDANADVLAAKVQSISPVLDTDTRTAKVRMTYDNRNGLLKPGMFGQASFHGKVHSGIVVPMSAIVQSGFYPRVFVEISPWRFVARVVTLGASVVGGIEVLSGLNAKDRIVVKNGVLLND